MITGARKKNKNSAVSRPILTMVRGNDRTPVGKINQRAHGWIVDFCLCSKTGLCSKLFWWKCMSPVRKSFSCEMCFAWVFVLKKDSNRNSRVEVESAYEPSGPSYQHFSRFLWHEVTRSISSPPRPSQGYPAKLICQYLFIHLSGKRHCESYM